MSFDIRSTALVSWMIFILLPMLLGKKQEKTNYYNRRLKCPYFTIQSYT